MGAAGRHGERVAVAGAGSGAFQRVIDGAGIEGHQIVEAAAVEGEILDLAFADHAGDRGSGGIDDRRFFGDRHLGDEFAHLKLEVDARILSHAQVDAGAVDGLEAGLLDLDFLGPEREREDAVVPEPSVVVVRVAPVSRLFTVMVAPVMRRPWRPPPGRR